MRCRIHCPIFAAVFIALALSSCSKEFQPLFEKGQKAFQNENYVEAVDTINLALPLWKESDGLEPKARAYQVMGMAYQRLRKLDPATDAYGQAIKISTQTFPSALNLGDIYLTEAKWDLSIQTYKRALQMKKDDPMALLGLGNAFFKVQKHQEAIFCYQRIIQTSPGVKEALENIQIASGKLKSTTKKQPARLKEKPKKKSKRR